METRTSWLHPMTESLDCQITIDDDVSFLNTEKKRNKVGRKAKVTKEKYLDAVEKLRTMDDKRISLELGVNRSNIYRFRNNPFNKEIILKAEKILNRYSDKIHIINIFDYDTFITISIISKWIKNLEDNRIAEKTKYRYVRYFFNMCNYLNIHPNNLTVEKAIEFNREIKKLYWNNEPQPRGLAYTYIRESIRSFYTIMHKISGEYLAKQGVTKEASKGQGRYAKQKVHDDVRHRLEETLKPIVNDVNEYLECLNADKFMYYTGTRINATLDYSFYTHEYNLQKDIWRLEVIDKSEHSKGRSKW